MSQHPDTISVNGRSYNWPQKPLVVVCIDGSEPAYTQQAIAAGKMPFTAKMLQSGADLRGKCVIPSFTNPNNLSIVTGVPPVVHGISGNYYLDRDRGEEVLMNDPALLTADTIFKAFQDQGARIAIVTAKDKLRRLLGYGLDYNQGTAVCFSSEKADQTSKGEHGIDHADRLLNRPIPSVYSADLSEYIFAAGVELLSSMKPDLMYLSTTDYVQHKHAPGTAEANAFYAMMDSYFAKLHNLGADLAMTADHGMNAKHLPGGAPDAIYLGDELDEKFGQGQTRVICPITDPYVVHHGALGSFVTVYVVDADKQGDVMDFIASLDGIDEVLNNAEGCKKFDLPTERMGDIIVVSDKNKVIGTHEKDHDLSGLKEPLRSHGGTSEQTVPMMFSRPVKGLNPNHPLRNFDIFHVALNHTI